MVTTAPPTLSAPMNATVPLGHWAGIPVRMHWSVLIVCALLAQVMATVVLPADDDLRTRWIAGALVALAFLVTLLVHELAHAVLARHYGIRVRRITLWLLGGMTEFENEAPSAKSELLVAAAGPLASLGSAAVFGAAATIAGRWHLPPVAVAGMGWLAAANVLLGAVNLLPGAPLDGGRVLRAVLWSRTGDRVRATVTAARAGSAVGVGFMAWGALQVFGGSLSGLWLVLLGWFLFEMATAEQRQTHVSAHLGKLTARQAMTTDPVTASGWWTVDTFLKRTARHQHHRVYPVVDFDDALCGVTSLSDLAAVPPEQRMSMRLSTVARPLTKATRVSPDTPLIELARGARLDPGRDLVLVVADDRLLGVVSASDIARTMELTALGEHPRGPSTETLPGWENWRSTD
jgi:Zn-dependent protease/CBS domain-containing protein